MKLLGLLAIACLVVGASSVAACAADTTPDDTSNEDAGDTTPTPDAGGSSAFDSATPVAHDSAPPPVQDAGACVPTCTADTDCQNSCPAVSTGINCCDTATGACYTAAQSSCPAPQPDSGGGTGPY